MKIDNSKLINILKKLKKNELLELIDYSIHRLSESDKRNIFGGLYREYTKKNSSPKKLLKEIKKFEKESLNGKYYADFMINSKNYMHVPDETDEWFDEIGNFLDLTSTLVENENYEIAKQCFDLLFKLIEHMENGEEIVFADEYGDWMISHEKDYVENYIIALSKTVEIREYTEKVIPILKRDSWQSFSSKAYLKMKIHASKEQLAATEKEIEIQSIKTKST